MAKKLLLICYLFVLSTSPAFANPALEGLKQYIATQKVGEAGEILSKLDLKEHAPAILSISDGIKIPEKLKHYFWAAAYHAYVNDQNVDRQQVAFLLGEAGAEVSQETPQGLLLKAYMLEHFYVTDK